MDETAQLAAAGLFDARPPRYTSYPAAPHFTGAVGPAANAAWLAAAGEAGAPVSLYIHIPFCRRLCWFCACRTQGVLTDAPILAYLDALEREIETVGDAIGRVAPAARLHLGGGTPTILKPELMARLSAALRRRFRFEDDAEISVEIDPNEIDEARIDALVALGMNRASLGVQDFDPAIQQAIGREQSFRQTAETAQALRAAGVRSLNVDLVYGLPGQRPDGLRRTIRRLLWLRPDRIALYGYAHAPNLARRQVMIREDDLPDPRARFELAEGAREILIGAGYRPIGFDHFALPEDGLAQAQAAGRLRRNFQGYTDDAAGVLIGLGASAISEFPQGYAQNAPATADWMRAVREGRLATARGHAFAGEDIPRKKAINQLLCDFALDLNAPELAPHRGILEADLLRAALTWPEFVAYRGGRLVVLPEGRPLVRLVAQAFDGYAREAARYSLAV